MSRGLRRATLIGIGVVMALVAIAQYFGWISSAPPLLAPGIQ